MKNERRWDELKAFLVRTGDEIRRELEKLVVEIRDPDKAHRVKVGLQHLGSWAKSTAEEVATRVDEAITRRTGKGRRKSPAAPSERRTAFVPSSSEPVSVAPAGKKKKRTQYKARPSAAVPPAGRRSRPLKTKTKKAKTKVVPPAKRTKRPSR